jgi:hypothetical protein
MANHFSKCHRYHQLCVSFHCQRCNAYIDPAERREHVRAHMEQDVFHRPFSPPTPTINPVDNSLSFVRSCHSPEVTAEHQSQNDVRILARDTQLTSSTFHSDSSSPFSQDPRLIPDTCDITTSSPILDPSQPQASEPVFSESPDSCNALAIPSHPTPDLHDPSQPQVDNLIPLTASDDPFHDGLPESFNPSPEIFPSPGSSSIPPSPPSHPSESSSDLPNLPISPLMPEFFDSSQTQCVQLPSSNIDSQQLSPPLSLSPNDSPSQANDLFGDEPDPGCLESSSHLRKRVVTHPCSPKVPVIQDSRIVLASCAMPSVEHGLPSDDLRHVIKVSRRNDRIVVSSQSPPPLPHRHPVTCHYLPVHQQA